MYEGSVGLRHAVRVFAALYGRALTGRGVHELAGQLLRHGAATAGPGGADEPAHRQRNATLGSDVYGDLVRGATNAARLDLDGGSGVAQGLIEDVDGGPVSLLFHALKRGVD